MKSILNTMKMNQYSRHKDKYLNKINQYLETMKSILKNIMK